MALLTPEDLANMTDALVENDRLITELTTYSLDGLCRKIYGTAPAKEKVAIIPITAGGGIIGSFSESLLFTVQHFGMDGFITENTDVAGWYEAVTKGADIILMADDLAYIAHNLRNGKIAHNQICTGRIYAEILCHAKGGKDGGDDKDVLVLGLGKVGTPALETFLNEKFNVYVFDVDSNRVNEIASQYPVFKYDSEKEPKSFFKIFEATPCPDTISESVLKQNSIVSTPGIPLGISDELIEKYNVRVVQEPLGIGTLSMLYAVFDEK
ncbi:3-methylornithyl-N6-L-lysine dehydrogenase PylD [Methanimicrococcus blatticola]|uniref:Pyrrolysine biosynthesis protein PylD n=1 Tax=Methanimicrococcus blatticola TaxID=91560 RepID=A0A484F5W1_9EURY|nr:3-methylornithyl-N6-L-lysine dehydrogenase PylD [Methanimicrococcus blatticola]MBZ3936179.1 3-methylornithyl-N6-L-lysine dehydrogenase PylD [Methanimicrococcus blatticola]MCC2508422.1 3-methylornithyl-N6-L-lysine dehydrogenase PylD [Methanimicrococcus blatticola]TDQ70125.1 pyrrolysine biosynthesis protein PylD [Methanimicrococcus blatticola]